MLGLRVSTLNGDIPQTCDLTNTLTVIRNFECSRNRNELKGAQIRKLFELCTINLRFTRNKEFLRVHGI